MNSHSVETEDGFTVEVEIDGYIERCSCGTHDVSHDGSKVSVIYHTKDGESEGVAVLRLYVSHNKFWFWRRTNREFYAAVDAAVTKLLEEAREEERLAHEDKAMCGALFEVMDHTIGGQ